MPYSSFEPNGNVVWRFRAEKQVSPNEDSVVFQGDAYADSGGVPQPLIDSLYADGWRVIVYKDQNHTAALDTGVPSS